MLHLTDPLLCIWIDCCVVTLFVFLCSLNCVILLQFKVKHNQWVTSGGQQSKLLFSSSNVFIFFILFKKSLVVFLSKSLYTQET